MTHKFYLIKTLQLLSLLQPYNLIKEEILYLKLLLKLSINHIFHFADHSSSNNLPISITLSYTRLLPRPFKSQIKEKMLFRFIYIVVKGKYITRIRCYKSC